MDGGRGDDRTKTSKWASSGVMTFCKKGSRAEDGSQARQLGVGEEDNCRLSERERGRGRESERDGEREIERERERP